MKCAYCGCTEERACMLDRADLVELREHGEPIPELAELLTTTYQPGKPVGCWWVSTDPPVCSNPRCVAQLRAGDAVERLTESLFTVLSDDTRWVGIMLAGPEICSRCKQPIDDEEVAIRAWPPDGRWEVRYHPKCLGFESFDDVETTDETTDEGVVS